MPPGGIHLAIGMWLGKKTTQRHFRLGIIFGSILPDIDLLFSVIIFLITKNLNEAISIHRTVTHSFVTYTTFLILVMISTLTGITDEYVLSFAFGLWIGTSIHIVLDLFYLAGVQIFYPFGGFISLSPINYADLSPFWQRFLLSIDYLTDPLLFYIPLCKYVNLLKVDASRKRCFLLYFMIYWSVSTNLSFLLIGILIPVPIEKFVIMVYIPGIFTLTFSIFSPLIYRRTILHPKFSPYNYYQRY